MYLFSFLPSFFPLFFPSFFRPRFSPNVNEARRERGTTNRNAVKSCLLTVFDIFSPPLFCAVSIRCVYGERMTRGRQRSERIAEQKFRAPRRYQSIVARAGGVGAGERRERGYRPTKDGGSPLRLSFNSLSLAHAIYLNRANEYHSRPSARIAALR
jgi:hypothetical protein